MNVEDLDSLTKEEVLSYAKLVERLLAEKEREMVMLQASTMSNLLNNRPIRIGADGQMYTDNDDGDEIYLGTPDSIMTEGDYDD